MSMVELLESTAMVIIILLAYTQAVLSTKINSIKCRHRLEAGEITSTGVKSN